MTVSMAELTRGDDATFARAVRTRARQSQTDRLLLVQDARVVARLGSLLRDDAPEEPSPVKDEPTNEDPIKEEPAATEPAVAPSQPWPVRDIALEALVALVRGCSLDSRRKLAAALPDDAVAWLVRRDDTALLPTLAVDDAVFEARVARARGVQYYVAKAKDHASDPRVVARAVHALLLMAQSGDTRTIQQQEALDALVELTHAPDTADAVVDAVAASIGGLDAASRVLLRSPLELHEHVGVLRGSRRGFPSLGRQRCAALCISALVVTPNHDQVARIVDQGGVLALVQALEVEVVRHRETEAKAWPIAALHVVQCVLDALMRLATREPLVCLEIKACGGLASLVAIACTRNCPAIAREGVHLLEQFFLADTETRALVALTGGVRFLVCHLRDGVVEGRKVATLGMLASMLLNGDEDTRTEMLERFEGEGGVDQLVWLCDPMEPGGVRHKAESLLQSLPEIIASLLARGDEAALKTLEVMARRRANQIRLITKHRAVEKLVNKLVNPPQVSTQSIQCSVIRVLMHLVSDEEAKHQLLIHTDRFIELLSGHDNGLSTVAATMLLKLASDHVSRDAIAPAIPLAIEILRSEGSNAGLCEASTRLLAELVRERHNENRELIVTSGGLSAFLNVLRDVTSTWKMCQAASAVLWRLAKHDDTVQTTLKRTGGVAALHAVVDRDIHHPIEAAEKLLAILERAPVS